MCYIGISCLKLNMPKPRGHLIDLTTNVLKTLNLCQTYYNQESMPCCLTVFIWESANIPKVVLLEKESLFTF
jgi:hypothetical protein